MAQCEVCGNQDDKAFQVVMDGTTHVLDSFECPIHALAPTCAHSGVRIVRHGLEDGGTFYCCAHYAKREGITRLQVRV